jgi:two-component system sensor histidine kinase AlgZ
MRSSRTLHNTAGWRAWLISLRQQPRLDGADYLLPDLCHGEGLLGMIILAEMLSTLMVIAANGLVTFDWAFFARMSLMALMITLVSASILSKANRFLVGASRAVGVLVSYGLVLLTTLLCTGLAEIARTSGASAPLFDPLQVGRHLALTALPAAIVLSYLLLHNELRKQQRAELQARIQPLQSRIRPHFLFNIMNMIASLIGSDPEKAERVVEDLSDLFRQALADAQTLIPLREELALCRSYLALEQLRLGDRLKVVWQISDYGVDAKIPCLTLQPVLENAIYHGIQLLPDGGEINVSVKRVKDRMEIVVRNPSYPRMHYNKGAKMAIENVRLRLQAHFGPGAQVTSEARESSYITRISYPLARLR